MFLLLYLDSSKCCNCKRLQFDTDIDSVYSLQFHLVKSNEIRRAGHKCQFIRRIVSEKIFVIIIFAVNVSVSL